MDDDLRERDFDVVLIEQDLHLAVHSPQYGIPFQFVRTGIHSQGHAAVLEFLDAHVRRPDEDVRDVLLHFRHIVLDDLLDAFDVFAIRNGDVANGGRRVDRGVNRTPYVGVIDDEDVAVKIFDLRDADADLADNAAVIADLDDVADQELLFKDDEETGEDILDQALGAEGNGQAQDAGGRQ